MNWYVVQTKPKQEQIAEYNLKNQGFDVFLPQYQATKIIHKKLAQVIEPFFPAYIFVSFDILKDRWRSIHSTKGVQKLVASRDDTATPLPRGFIEALKAQRDDDGYLNPHNTNEALMKFNKGDEITINHGPFIGISGTYERSKKDNVVLLLSLLTGKTIVELPRRMVELQAPVLR
jgi:transcriptional antiterminator RfaH